MPAPMIGGLVNGRVRAHMYGMAQAIVIFKAQKVSDDDWQLICHCPGGKIEYVTGFLDEQSIKNWLASEHAADWLKARGFKAHDH